MKANLNTQHQKIDAIHRIVDNILTRAGCGGCGRLAFLHFDVHGDPGPELGKEGVISVISERL